VVVLQQGEAALARIAQAAQSNGAPRLGEVHRVRPPLLSVIRPANCRPNNTSFLTLRFVIECGAIGFDRTYPCAAWALTFGELLGARLPRSPLSMGPPSQHRRSPGISSSGLHRAQVPELLVALDPDSNWLWSLPTMRRPRFIPGCSNK